MLNFISYSLRLFISCTFPKHNFRPFPSVSATCDKCKSTDRTPGHIALNSEDFGMTFPICNVLYIIKTQSLMVSAILGCSTQCSTFPLVLTTSPHDWYGCSKKIYPGGIEICPSHLKHWLNDMVSCLYLKDICYTLSDTHSKFQNVWRLFIACVNKKKCQSRS